MGVVIRPAIFAREIAASRLKPIQKPIRAWRARLFDLRFAALLMALMALAWILALAGTAFAVRAVMVLCFAHLAGRARRVGVPAAIVRRRAR